MKEVILKINLPENIDLEHAHTSISDALFSSDNVTQSEYNLIRGILSQLKSNIN